MIITIQDYLKSKCEIIEQHLDTLVSEKSAPCNQLYKAARYSLLGGGKRLRPVLALAATETLNGNLQAALSPACALEMIHTYSMIHDDLPCMDNDDFRRGKPSLHKAFPEGHAVLAGDFLLTYAFEVLSEAPLLTAEQKIILINILSRQSGGEGMIGGQIMDLEAEGRKIDIETLRQIHRCKTGAMISASIEFGGVIANAREHMEALREFGKEIGIAFQIVDDILDLTSSKQKHGKSVSSDITNNKATYVTLLGLDQAKASAISHYQSAIQALSHLPGDTTLLAGLADLIVNRKY